MKSARRSFWSCTMKSALVLLACLLAVQSAWAAARVNPNEGHKGLAMGPGKFERIFIIQFENQPYMFVKDDPNFQKYTKMGVHLTNYYGVTHPSQPNVRTFLFFCKCSFFVRRRVAPSLWVCLISDRYIVLFFDMCDA